MAKDFDLDHNAKLSLFETIIRIVGGLIAAYDASGDAVFLKKADELAAILLSSFQSTEQGMTHSHP